MTSSYDYEVRSAAGALMLTTPDRKAAIRHAKDRAQDFPGIRVEVVERIEHRRTVWKPRKAPAPTVAPAMFCAMETANV